MAASYELKSELARVCLPAPENDAYRRLAWVNSICMLFLIIGVVGARSRLPDPKRPPPMEQPIPVVIEPLATPPPTTTEQKQVEPQNEKEIAPRVVAVTLNTPAIDFSVPTVGNLLVPAAAAPAPPPVELEATVETRHVPTKTGATGEGGDRPSPPYPETAQQQGQQGTVVLVLTVDEVGGVQTVEVKETSGFAILDRNAREWVKRHWIQPPINGNHLFQTSIKYVLRNESE